MKKIDVIFISIHSLRMEGDGKFSSKSGRGQLFQSTPSAWRETRHFLPCSYGDVHFNPLPPHGGRLAGVAAGTVPMSFQSTPSAWRETEFNHEKD